MNLEEHLFHYFGHTTFRSVQKEVVMSILDGSDTLALLPTGAGKSICFQLPALLLPGITIVVSPLIALMKDQVDNLLKKNIMATYLSSTLSEEEKAERLRLIHLQKYKIIYVAPERLTHQKFLASCRKLPISLVVIDEAHCISEWGYDFRPSYLMIHDFIGSLVTRPKVAAFTATATKKTIADIINRLQLNQVRMFRQSFLRTNLHIRIFPCPTTMIQETFLFLLLQKYKNKSGIIYTATRQAAADLTSLINTVCSKEKKLAAFYHAAMKPKERQNTQQLFISNKIPIIVATSAFGMGIDKPDIAFVIHFHVPASVEQYYQEIGRAGRDGELAECFMLYNKNNLIIHQTLLTKNIRSSDFLQEKMNTLKKFVNYCESQNCRQQFLLEYFSEKMDDGCQYCDNCLRKKDESLNILDILLTPQQKEHIKILKKRREFLQEKFSVSYPEEILTSSQLLLLTATTPEHAEEFEDLASFGRGWCDKWASYFLFPDVTIQAQ